jgi:hypothetical protein
MVASTKIQIYMKNTVTGFEALSQQYFNAVLKKMI